MFVLYRKWCKTQLGLRVYFILVTVDKKSIDFTIVVIIFANACKRQSPGVYRRFPIENVFY